MRGEQVLLATLEDLSFTGVPTRARLTCQAVHPNACRQAVCDRDLGHDGYHATEDRRTEWETADVGEAGGISCVTIDRAAANQRVWFGPLKPGDAMVRLRYPPAERQPGNRHERRKASKRRA